MKNREELIEIFNDIVTTYDGLTARICIISTFPTMYVRMDATEGCMYIRNIFDEKESKINPETGDLKVLNVLLNDLRDPIRTTYYNTDYLNKLESGEF